MGSPRTTQEKTFEWDASTASGYHPIPFNHLSSPTYSGDHVKIYCHVAAVDKMGIIGPTTHAGPYSIDTMPPEFAYISAPLSSQIKTITVHLHALDVQEVYLSSSGYEMGSIWQPYRQNLTYVLQEQTGNQIIYASFRDRARNVSRTHIVTSINKPLVLWTVF